VGTLGRATRKAIYSIGTISKTAVYLFGCCGICLEKRKVSRLGSANNPGVDYSLIYYFLTIP
jgi:hypothetical protein